MTRMRLQLTVQIALLLVCGVAECLAQTRIYLAEYKYNDPRMYSMGADGGDLEELSFIPTSDWLLVGVQIDTANDKIYWTHGSSGAGRIRRAGLDGSNMEILVSGLTNARGLALDAAGGKMYWSDTQDDKMYRANLDGSDMEAIIDTGHQLGRPTLDLVNNKIYFGNYGAGDMRCANLDGSDQEILFSGLWTPVAVALDLDGGKIYWADSNTIYVSNHIARANFDGSDREIVYQGEGISSGFTGIGLDLDAGKVYWCDEIEYTVPEKGVWEANLDGTEAHRIFVSPDGWNAGAMTVVVAASPCSTDVNEDGTVDVLDLLAVLSAWGACTDCAEDINGDGLVDVLDLLEVLSAWGPC